MKVCLSWYQVQIEIPKGWFVVTQAARCAFAVPASDPTLIARLNGSSCRHPMTVYLKILFSWNSPTAPAASLRPVLTSSTVRTHSPSCHHPHLRSSSCWISLSCGLKPSRHFNRLFTRGCAGEGQGGLSSSYERNGRNPMKLVPGRLVESVVWNGTMYWFRTVTAGRMEPRIWHVSSQTWHHAAVGEPRGVISEA